MDLLVELPRHHRLDDGQQGCCDMLRDIHGPPERERGCHVPADDPAMTDAQLATQPHGQTPDLRALIGQWRAGFLRAGFAARGARGAVVGTTAEVPLSEAPEPFPSVARSMAGAMYSR